MTPPRTALPEGIEKALREHGCMKFHVVGQCEACDEVRREIAAAILEAKADGIDSTLRHPMTPMQLRERAAAIREGKDV